MIESAVRQRCDPPVRTLLDSTSIPPNEKLEGWKTRPFEPVVDGHRIPLILKGDEEPGSVPLRKSADDNRAPNESTRISLYLAGVRTGLHLIESMSR
jgi:hypothetical protein